MPVRVPLCLQVVGRCRSSFTVGTNWLFAFLESLLLNKSFGTFFLLDLQVEFTGVLLDEVAELTLHGLVHSLRFYS